MKKSNWMARGFGRFVSPDLVSEEFLDDEVIVLLQGSNPFGDELFLYLQITGQNLRAIFQFMQEGENFKPVDYGKVIVAGRGEPPGELKAEMLAEHNMIDVPKPKVLLRPGVAPSFYDDDSADEIKLDE